MKVALFALMLVGSSQAWAQDVRGVADAQATAAAPGAKRVTLLEGSSTEEDGRTDWNLPLDPSQCYWFSGAGGSGVKRLSLYLWNPSGKRVADQKPDAPIVVMQYCPEVVGMFHLQAKTSEGHGAYAVGVVSKDAPPKAPPPPPLDVAAICDQTAAAAAPGAERTGPHFLGSGDRAEWAVALQPGTCYWIAGCGNPATVKKLSLYLWGPDNKRITESRPGNPSPMIGHCATIMGMHKVQAKIEKGSGEFHVGIYAKKNQ